MNTIGVFSLEGLCMLFTGTLILGTLFEYKRKNLKEWKFLFCLELNLLALAVDAASNGAEYCRMSDAVIWSLSLAAYLVGFFLVPVFTAYFVSRLETQPKATHMHVRIQIVLSVIACILATIGACRGSLFTVENNVFTVGSSADISAFIVLVQILYLLAVLLLYKKGIPSTEIYGMGIYILISLLFGVWNCINPELSVRYVGSTISLQILYLMIQAWQNGHVEEQREELPELSRTDELTGLMNRRAFDEFCDAHENTENGTGILFVDMNGLKYTNDNYGSKAGDDMILNLTEILKAEFRMDCIYRISGDEFVVLMHGISQIAFMDRTQALRDALHDNIFPLAAMGAIYSVQKKTRESINEAEALMFKDKERFHQKYPKYCGNRN